MRTRDDDQDDDIADSGGPYWRNIIYYALFHLLPFGALFSGVTWSSVVCCGALYFSRIFFITAGYHCLFAHRSYKTSRVFQFIMAFGAQASGQGSVIKWAAAHRYHHANADRESDVHSPVRRGFFYSHIGWLLDRRYTRLVDFHVPYLDDFPELRWLDRYFFVPTLLVAIAVTVFFGWPGLFIGYGLSTVLTFHATFTVNSLTHMFGSRRYDTVDGSRNNWFVAVIMLGGGWHNNHHRYPRSARQGFHWWEIDITYYLLRVLQVVRLVWDICSPPNSLLAGQDGADSTAER